MKAIIYTKYGSPDVLQFTDTAKPIPGDDDVLVRIHAASVNAADWQQSCEGNPSSFVPCLVSPSLETPSLAVIWPAS